MMIRHNKAMVVTALLLAGGASRAETPAASVSQVDEATSTYAWSLGVDLFAGGGQIGATKGVYSPLAAGVRIKADTIVAPSARVGVEGFLQLTHVGFNQGVADSLPPQFSHNALDIADAGAAVYKHVCIAERACVTPLVGGQLALMTPHDNPNESRPAFRYIALGGRAELDLTFALGMRHEHVLAFMMGVDVYSHVLSSPDMPVSAKGVGLDAGGAFGYAGVGYAYRFDVRSSGTQKLVAR